MLKNRYKIDMPSRGKFSNTLDPGNVLSKSNIKRKLVTRLDFNFHFTFLHSETVEITNMTI